MRATENGATLISPEVTQYESDLQYCLTLAYFFGAGTGQSSLQIHVVYRDTDQDYIWTLRSQSYYSNSFSAKWEHRSFDISLASVGPFRVSTTQCMMLLVSFHII